MNRVKRKTDNHNPGNFSLLRSWQDNNNLVFSQVCRCFEGYEPLPWANNLVSWECLLLFFSIVNLNFFCGWLFLPNFIQWKIITYCILTFFTMTKIKYSVIITMLVMCVMSAACSKRDPKGLHSSFHRAFSKGRTDDSNSLLDTFSLSWSGNFNFSNSLEGIQKIFEGIFTCEYICVA